MIRANTAGTAGTAAACRVLHVNATLDPVTGGGTAERTFRLARADARAGLASTVLTLDLGLSPERVAALEPARVLALPCLSRRFYLPRCSPRRVRAAVADADVVHLTGHWTLLNAMAYAAARREGKPYVVCPAGALPLYGRSRVLKAAYNLLVGRRLVRDAMAHVAITAEETRHFGAYGVYPPSVAVIPNGVDPDDQLPDTTGAADDDALRSRLGCGRAPFVLFLGRLNPIKGPDLLLAAFAEVRERSGHHLVFAGPDERMRAELERFAARAGLTQRVHFPGPLGGADKDAAYRAADLLAVPSRQESMSLVALEAALRGTPVLLTEECGFDQVAHAGGGRVVPATVAGLAGGLRELLGEPAALPAMGERLRRLVLNSYTWAGASAAYRDIYAALAPDPARTASERQLA